MRRHHTRLLLPALVLASLSAACSSTPSTPAASSAVEATTGAATTAPTGSPTPMPSGSSMPIMTTPAVASPTGRPQPSPTAKPARSSLPTTTTTTTTKPARSSMPTTTTPAAVRGAATLAVRIKDYAFTIPGPVKAGGKITVRNDDSEIHTFTLDGKNPLSVPGHSTATRTAPIQPGKHQVTCDYHGDMHGTLTVTA